MVPTIRFGFRLGLFGALYEGGAATAEAKLSGVVAAGGFSRVRGATEAPFNRVLEARIERRLRIVGGRWMRTSVIAR